MMKIHEILPQQNILLNSRCKTKEEAIACMVNLLFHNGYIREPETLKREIWQREYLAYTGIGNHIALAHTESETTERIVAACTRLEGYVDWAPDTKYPSPHKMIKFILLFVVPKTDCEGEELLKSMVLKLGKKEHIEKLMWAKESIEVVNVFQ